MVDFFLKKDSTINVCQGAKNASLSEALLYRTFISIIRKVVTGTTISWYFDEFDDKRLWWNFFLKKRTLLYQKLFFTVPLFGYSKKL